MKSIFFTARIFLLTGIANTSYCQTPATDPSNTGQLKRMVYDDWNDWQPDPGTHFFGIIPNNVLGFFWWRIVNPGYYRGDDKRPYKPDGPFVQNTASLSVQKGTEGNIADSNEAINNTALATYINMNGGAADIPYLVYFKKQFANLAAAGMDFVQDLSIKNPRAYSRLIISKVYADYVERLDIQTSRIKTIHEAFVEKGARVLAYLEIKKQMEFQNEVLGHYVKNYLSAMTIPDSREIKAAGGTIHSKNDAEIVKNILSTFKF